MWYQLDFEDNFTILNPLTRGCQCSESNRVQNLEQSLESIAADKLEREREREREREERKTKSNYTGSFHNLEVVMSPL